MAGDVAKRAGIASCRRSGLAWRYGFYYSVFISGLGFSDNPAALQMTKAGILTASFFAVVLGFA